MERKLGAVGRALVYSLSLFSALVLFIMVGSGDVLAILLGISLIPLCWAGIVRVIYFVMGSDEGVIDVDRLSNFLEGRRIDVESNNRVISDTPFNPLLGPTNRVMGEDNRDLVSAALASVRESKTRDTKPRDEEDQAWFEMTRVL